MEFTPDIWDTIQKLMNILRVGIVDSINPSEGTVRVVFEDKDDVIGEDLPLLDRDYNMPKIGQQVLCLFLPNGLEEGYCLGSFYSLNNKPPTNNKDLYIKQFEGLKIQYNKATKQLTIDSANPITINGNLQVNGTITSTP